MSAAPTSPLRMVSMRGAISASVPRCAQNFRTYSMAWGHRKSFISNVSKKDFWNIFFFKRFFFFQFIFQMLKENLLFKCVQNFLMYSMTLGNNFFLLDQLVNGKIYNSSSKFAGIDYPRWPDRPFDNSFPQIKSGN